MIVQAIREVRIKRSSARDRWGTDGPPEYTLNSTPRKTPRRGISSPGSPDRLDDPAQKEGRNPDGATPADLPSKTAPPPPAQPKRP